MSRQPRGIDVGTPHRQRAVLGGQRRRGHVAGQQAHRGEPAVVRQLGQGGGQGHPGGEPHRRLHRAGHDHRQAAGRGDPQRRPHPAERLRLEHDDVRCAGRANRHRVLGTPDRLVGGQRHVHQAAQLGQLRQGGAGLFGVFEAEPAQGPQHPGRVLNVPAAVRVDPDPPGRADRVTHRLHPGQVVRIGLATLGHLDLRGPAARPGDDLVRLVRAYGGHGHVHADAVAHRRRPAGAGRLQRAGQPAGALARPVLGERRELAPARGAVDQRALTHGDAAEPGGHRDGERPDRRQQRGKLVGPGGPGRLPVDHSAVSLACPSVLARGDDPVPPAIAGPGTTPEPPAMPDLTGLTLRP